MPMKLFISGWIFRKFYLFLDKRLYYLSFSHKFIYTYSSSLHQTNTEVQILCGATQSLDFHELFLSFWRMPTYFHTASAISLRSLAKQNFLREIKTTPKPMPFSSLRAIHKDAVHEQMGPQFVSIMGGATDVPFCCIKGCICFSQTDWPGPQHGFGQLNGVVKTIFKLCGMLRYIS